MTAAQKVKALIEEGGYTREDAIIELIDMGEVSYAAGQRMLEAAARAAAREVTG